MFGEPLVHLGKDVGDVGVWSVFAGHECDTLEKGQCLCSFRLLGGTVQLGWGRHMKLFDAIRLEGLSAEWTGVRREIPKTSGRVKQIRCRRERISSSGYARETEYMTTCYYMW